MDVKMDYKETKERNWKKADIYVEYAIKDICCNIRDLSMSFLIGLHFAYFLIF